VKIRYTEFVPNPALRNTETNLPAHVAQVLIAQGSAVAVPFKTYADFLSSKNPPAVAVPVEWGIKEAGAYSPVCVIKRTANGETFYKTPPPDCPASIVDQWRSLADGSEVPLSPAEAKVLEDAYRNKNGDGHRKIHTHNDRNGKPVFVDAGDFLQRKTE
jgi:hypothetical protein